MVLRKKNVSINMLFLLIAYYSIYHLASAIQPIISCVERFNMLDQLERASSTSSNFNNNSYMLLRSFTLLNEANVYRGPKELIALYGDYIFKRKFLSGMFNASAEEIILTGIDTNNIYHDNSYPYLDINHYFQYLSINDKRKNFDYFNIIKLSLKPSRIALHEIIVSVVTQLQLEDQADLQYWVRILYARLLKKILSSTKKIDAKRELLYKYSINSNGLKKTNVSAIFLIKEEKYYYHQISQIIKSIVSNEIKHLISALPEIKIIEIPAPEDRITFIQAGAAGSGKSSLLPLLKDKIKNFNIFWKNIVKIDSDQYNVLLLEQNQPFNELHAQMVSYEAMFVKKLIQVRLLELLSVAKMPHILFDQVYLTPQQFVFSLAGGGKIDINIVSTEVGTAILRCCQRGRQIGRYLSTPDILTMHKTMIESLFTTLATFKENKISVDIIDNNGPYSKTPELIMSADIEHKQFIVHNEEKFNAFLMKFLININANTTDNLYFNNTSVLTKSSLHPLMKNGFFRLNTFNDTNNNNSCNRKLVI